VTRAQAMRVPRVRHPRQRLSTVGRPRATSHCVLIALRPD
jgi:hypothetical protein